MRKGIILAGGTGSRLFPLTRSVSKQLLPIYDKPMIFYPLSTLIRAGIRHILVITAPRDTSSFRELLGDGSDFGIKLEYLVQPRPEGIAQSILIATNFIGDAPVALILGDNILHGEELIPLLVSANSRKNGATIFAKVVPNPSDFGVVELSESRKVLSVEEKPFTRRSNLAIVGMYFFDHRCIRLAEAQTPSPRGELEITDLVKAYQEADLLQVQILSESTAWFDAVTVSSLLRAQNFVSQVQACGSQSVGCLEEVAYSNGLIDREQLLLAADAHNNSYGRYLKRVAALSKPQE